MGKDFNVIIYTTSGRRIEETVTAISADQALAIVINKRNIQPYNIEHHFESLV